MSTSSPAPATGELMLRPGVPVVRREADTLQVGLRPPLAVRLPDRPEVRALLAGLRGGVVADRLDPTAAHALAALRAAGLVLPGSHEPDQRELTAARAQFGDDAARRLAARRGHGIGLRADPPARPLAAELLTDAGAVVDDVSPAVWLVVTTGPVVRESIDPLVRAGVPHLLVSGDAAGRRLGPFVEPGRTACLRCIDAYESEADPRLPFLVEQAALSGDGTGPLDRVLDRLVLAWAVRDLCRYLEGDQPGTWSTTVDVAPGGPPEIVERRRHPHCGCAWDLLLDLP